MRFFDDEIDDEIIKEEIIDNDIKSQILSLERNLLKNFKGLPAFSIDLYGDLNYLHDSKKPDDNSFSNLRAYREFNDLRRCFFRRLYKIASEHNGAFITDGVGTKFRTFASVLGVIKNELKYKLGDKVPMIGINQKSSSEKEVKFEENHILLMDPSESEDPTGYKF